MKEFRYHRDGGSGSGHGDAGCGEDERNGSHGHDCGCGSGRGDAGCGEDERDGSHGQCGCGTGHGHAGCGEDERNGSHGQCGCGCGHGDAEDEERAARLLLETRGAVTLAGIAGALIDLGTAPLGELTAMSAALGLAVPRVCVDVVKACRGVRVETEPGPARDRGWLAARIDRARERDAEAAVLVEQIYRVIAATQEAEQGSENADLGALAREDVFALYLWVAMMLTRTGTEGLTVAPIELGCGEYLVEGRTVSAPASLAARFVEGLEIVSTAGARGIDVPSAALIAACTVAQNDGPQGLLGACGYGLDGDGVTRVYLTETL